MDKRIMYCCELCAESAPESCGYWDLNDIAVMPDGTWLCEICADEPANLRDHGMKPSDPDDADWPSFYDFPRPPEYVPMGGDDGQA